jgi:RNA polymerase sigma-70 factor (ECF subfamily)
MVSNRGMDRDQAYEELLVLRCQDGEQQALGELVDRWQGRFVGHACRLMGQPEAARDAVQEAWIAIVRGLGGLDDPARFAPWAYRIVRNKCVDWVRRQGRRRRLGRELEESRRREEELALAGGREAPGPDRLIDALRALPRDRQALLSLYYQDGFSVREIAGILGIPAGTVKSRLFHARNRLRDALEGGRDD